jgi:MFS family permease
LQAELNAPQDVLTCTTRRIDITSPLFPAHASTYSSTSLASSSANEVKLPQCIPMTPAQFGLVSSIFTLGGLIGALSAGPISQRYGRLNAMLWGTIFFIAGPLLEGLAGGIVAMAIGRFLSGLGAGGAVVVVPIYISEIAPPAEKGFWGSTTQVMINFGIFVTQLLGFFLAKGNLWRIILGAGGIFGVLQLGGLLLGGIESPKWAADAGNVAQAKKGLRRLRGPKVDIHEEVSAWGTGDDPEDHEDEEDALLHNEADARNSSDERPRKREIIKKEVVGVFEVLRHPEYNRATFAVMMVMVAQQFCGINSIVMYGVSLLTTLLSTSSALLNLFVSLLNLVVTLMCAPLIDILGRKPVLLLSISGMGLSSLLLALSIIFHIPPLSVVAVVTFVGSFGLGLGPVPFILSSELVGPEAVGATQSWALAANWLATFVVAQFFPVVNEKLGKGKVYFIFMALAIFFGAFVAWCVPETRGKKDADEVWGRDRRRQPEAVDGDE